ncbi:hypothetical protein GBAR_LOCUS18294 [Geodia barretti]|uniref:Uncharacterized protein n=1 Tax=Geodia barretti TaxID=519541 RepID=A0AA35SNI2_GEOBA|nr:hypothetical protein GBAR_LOCUS18294 [Geodia barretti]
MGESGIDVAMSGDYSVSPINSSVGLGSGTSAGFSLLTSATLTLPTFTPSPTPLVTSSLLPPPPLPSPPLHDPPEMSLAPVIYLIAVPVALCILLVIMITLICCIICCYRLRRRKSRRNKSERLKTRSSGSRLDRSKSLEAYGGRSSHSMSKTEEATKRYELQTLDGEGNRFSEGSLGSPTAPLSSNILPGASRSHAAPWSSSPHINYTQPMSPYHYNQSPYPGSTPPHQHPFTSPRHTAQLHGIPESHGDASPHEKYTAMTKHGKTSSLPHSYSEGVSFDPASVYDVPASARWKFQDPNNPRSVYDIPKGALIASGHYKVPPLAQSVPLEGVYDVPPSSTAIYDVPPDVYNTGSEVYDVPPPTATRPRLNSQPTSQEELLAARRSLVAVSTGPDAAFATAGSDYSHYDVPRHFLISQPHMNHYQQPAKRLSRRNSYSPSQTARDSLVYDVPRTGGPPTAVKPYKKRNTPSRNHSIASPPNMASPERRQYPNEVFYDVPPLDPEFLAQLGQTSSTSSESDTSHLTKNGAGAATPTQRGHHMSPSGADSAGRSRAPPPTKRKPGRRGESVIM